MTAPAPATSDRPGGAAAAAFSELAARVVEGILDRHPVEATSLGDHRGDDRLGDASPVARDAERRELAGWLRELEALDVAALPVPARADAGILRTRLDARRFELEELRPHRWDPLEWNPGTAVYQLLTRDHAPLGDRLRALAGRLAAVPAHLDCARRTLGAMPRVHVETAVGQFAGTRTLLAAELERALQREPSLRAELDPARDAAVAALDEHLDWLRSRLDDPVASGRTPRLGAELYGRRLALALDAQRDPAALLERAEADLAEAEVRIAEVAGRLGGTGPGGVRRTLDRLAAEGHVDDATIVGRCEEALVRTAEFVRDRDLVTVYDDPVEIIVMPEFHRGVAVAYCDPPGPLETTPLPTYFAVSPTPADWPAERVASFYREYNAHMLHNLTVHEAMPGHGLQLGHSRRHAGPTPVRSAFWSGPFVEGWAVYAEELMADCGYAGAGAADAVRMQQLKMALRVILNAILDVRVHCAGMTEEEAMSLLVDRGHQEEGEAAGKWQRALLTSAQLSTYYVGYTEVSDVARELRAARPGASARELHDALLGHGSPPPRHLRALLGL